MSRRTSRPPTKISKQAASTISDIRRAQISNVVTSAQDAAEVSAISGSIVHSQNYKKAQMSAIKQASITSPMGSPTSSSHSDMMGPEIYSPLFQISNLNLPRDRVTMNAWNRIFYDTHPIVRNAINLHASFPISKINITCENKKVQNFFMDLAEKIDLYSVVYGVALEFWKLGEAFPYAELDETNGVWSRISILNPDYIHVKKSVIGDQTLVSLRPDASLVRLVNSNSPSDKMLKKYIPDHIIKNVKKGQNIPLDNFNVSHLKLLSSPYDIRGTSVIVSVYKDLMLYDKLRESKFAQADGMINPLTLVKLGGNDYRPTQADLESFRQILEEAQYDKDFKLVTHADVAIERVGYGGGVMDIAGDITHITENLYSGLMVPKAIMDQEGACVPVENTEILVEGKGFIKFDDFKEGDKIATLNPQSFELEFKKPNAITDYNFSGLMYSFKNETCDFESTDFHDILLSRDNGETFAKERALSVFNKDDIFSDKKFDSKYKDNVRFLNYAKNYTGVSTDFVEIPDKQQYTNVEFIRKIKTEDFCEFLGYYLSEGHIKIRSRDGKPCGVEVTQQPSSKGFKSMTKLFDRFEYSHTVVGEKHKRRGWYIGNTMLARFLDDNFGRKSEGKFIAEFVKSFSKEHLNILIEAMFLGDGSKNKNSSSGTFRYFTVSKKLANDFQEICLKAGYPTKLVCSKRNGNRKDIFKITVYKNEKSKRGKMRKYMGIVKPSDVSVSFVSNKRVFCFDVDNHIFITRKNGFIGIHGNSYASSSVGLEVLRQRYDIFRNMMKKWLERRIFAPICEMQDFFEYKDGKKRLLVPNIDFNHLNLYDMADYIQSISQFVTDKKVSMQTLHRSLGLSYEEERRRLREELVDESIFSKEQQILANMRLSELSNIDASKSIPEPADSAPAEAGGEGGGGLPGMDAGGGEPPV